jgi:hypothetical protein
MGYLLHALRDRTPLPAALAHYQGLAAEAELQRMRGAYLKPQAGCLIAEMPFGDATVLVEYEYTAAVRATFDDPAEPAQVTIVSVLVNGAMVDADLFADAVLDRWTQDILDSDQE